jgi:hypothetical protein
MHISFLPLRLSCSHFFSVSGSGKRTKSDRRRHTEDSAEVTVAWSCLKKGKENRR